MKKSQNNSKGFSLVEMAIALVIISISFIPIILMTTKGKNTNYDSKIIKEKAIINILMEGATSKKPEFIELINKNNVLEQKDTGNQIKTTITKYPNTDTYYRWIFKNLTYSAETKKRILPKGNYLIDCSLLIYDKKPTNTKEKPSITLGTKVIIQEPQNTFKEPLIGIIFLVDYTPSMSMSLFGWGHNPMNIKTESAPLNQEGVDLKDIAILNENDPPEKAIDFVYTNCNADITYGGSFGTPHMNYSENNDYIFGENLDDKSNETKTPTFNACEKITFAAPYSQEEAKNQCILLLADLKKATIENPIYIDSSISRIEMVRSSLYKFLLNLEKDSQEKNKYYKIGILPFSNITNPSFLLKPQKANKKGEYTKLKSYIKSINRDLAPQNINYKFTVNSKNGTDLEGAIRKAHLALIKDKELTHRVIVLITDWNNATEVGKIQDVISTRICLKHTIKNLQAIELKLISAIKKENTEKLKKNPNFKPDLNGEKYIKLKKISETKDWLIKFLPDAKEMSQLPYQPYSKLCTSECREKTNFPELETLAKNLSEGKINGAKGKETDLYIFGIIDAARPPAVSVLDKMTTFSKNGEFVVAKDIKQIPQLFKYLETETNRLLETEKAKRYEIKN